MVGRIITEHPKVYVFDPDYENKILCRYKNIFSNFSKKYFFKTDFATAWKQDDLQRIFLKFTRNNKVDASTTG